MPDDSETLIEKHTSPLAWVATVLILFPALVRTLVVYTPFPWWDSDPSMSLPTETAITPSGMLSLNLVTLVGATLAAWVCGSRTLWGVVLLTLGSVGVLIHAASDLEHLVVAGPWIAGLAGMLAAAWLGRDPAIRRVLLGLGLTVAAMYLARSMVQVWIDHPMLLRDFRGNRESILASRGWSPGSAQALLFERRLTQPDATAWFGLSNVLATFGAAACVFGLESCFGERRQLLKLNMVGLAVIGISLLWLTGSKGGWGAAVIGLIAGGAYSSLGRWNIAPRVRFVIPALLALGVLVLIGVRGWLGENLGELSLLFRAQYIEAAVRIFASEPMIGAGPAGFQDAYLLAKNPLNPEEVTSPHSVLFDWLATMGMFAVPWVVLLARRGIVLGSASCESPDPNPEPATSPPTHDPVSIRLVLLLPVAAFAVSAWFERGLLLPTDLIARVLGLGLWITMASVFVRLSTGSGVRAAHVGLAAALLAHFQIEMTPIMPSAAPLVFLLLGAALPSRDLPHTHRPRRIPGVIATGMLVGLTVTMGLLGLRPVLTWERHLHEAAEPMIGAGIRLRADKTQDPLLVLLPARARALESLSRAIDARPHHVPTRIAASRLTVSQALETPAHPAPWINSARGWIADREDGPISAREWVWLATLERILLEEGLAPDREETGAQMIEYLVRASRVDPHNPRIAKRLAETHAMNDHTDEAFRWAQLALELDAQYRLDPLKRFTQSEVRELQRMQPSP